MMNAKKLNKTATRIDVAKARIPLTNQETAISDSDG